MYRPVGISPESLQSGYWQAYRDFYRWGSILRGASHKPTLTAKLRHAAYAVGWKKLEPMWDWVIRARQLGSMLPVLESVLSGFRRSLNVDRKTNQKTLDRFWETVSNS